MTTLGTSQKTLNAVLQEEVRRCLSDLDVHKLLETHEFDLSALQVARNVAQMIAKTVTEKLGLDAAVEEECAEVAFNAVQESIVSAIAQAREYVRSGATQHESVKKSHAVVKENKMKITTKQLRQLIKEEYKRRLDELYPGSNIGSYLKQGVKMLWEADNMFQRALAEAEDNAQHATIEAVHKAIEKLAFAADDRMQKIIAGDVQKTQNKKKSVPQAPQRPAKKSEGDY